MCKAFLLSIIILFCFKAFCQTGFIVLKKKSRTIRVFHKDAPITFQTEDKSWITGKITAVKKDSFYFTRWIIHYNLLGSDTTFYTGLKYSLFDIKALPTKNEEIVFRGDQVHIILGNEKWVWVRNGLLLQITGAGYLGLSTINNVIRNNSLLAKNSIKALVIGALAYLTGTLMHHHFDPYIHIGKKYRLECLIVPTAVRNK